MIELLKTRRSIRRFQEKEVEKEKIDELVKAALLAPSSRSKRPWEFIIVSEKELLAKLSRCKEHGSHFLIDAPLGIVILADQELCDVWIEDSAITATIIQLTAHSMGLGSCWIQVRERFHNNSIKAEEYIKDTLNIPEKYKVLCILAIGYPDEEKKAYEEKDLLYNKIHLNIY